MFSLIVRLMIVIWGHFWQVVLDLGLQQDSHKNRISCLGLSADGSALCTGSWDSNLKVSVSAYIYIML